MQGFGERLRLRAKELGLTAAEVARRADLSAVRYGHYVTDYREPDLTTLVRICRVLGLRPDELLAFEQVEAGGDELTPKRAEITALAATMDAEILDLTCAVVRAMAFAANRGGLISRQQSRRVVQPARRKRRAPKEV